MLRLVEANILIAANPYDAEFMRRTLEDGGYSTVVWDGAGDLVELALRGDAAVLVLAQRAGGEACAAWLQRLRERERTRLPVLLISERSSEIGTLSDAVRMGADQLLLRPIEPLLLLSKIGAMVEQSGTQWETVRGEALEPRQRLRGRAYTALEQGESGEAQSERSPTLQGIAPPVVQIEEFRRRCELKWLNLQESSYFAVLELPHLADAAQIESAYRALCAEFSAERLPRSVSDQLGPALQRINIMIEEAYRVLRDDRLRDAYRSAL